ncbi:MAG: transglutaminase-like domain-containing protein, partial [Planctomycetota bacterium]
MPTRHVEKIHPTPTPSRSFHIRYETTLTSLPTGKHLRVWIPIPNDDAHQTIENLKIHSPWPTRITTEPVHHDRLVFLEGAVDASEMQIIIEYHVDRWQYSTDFAKLATDGPGEELAFAIYREPTSLAVITEEIEIDAARISRDHEFTLGKARAFYLLVQEQMIYDKSVDGWGRGDTQFACRVGKGNCTDYHSYFNSLCRAAGIPARFQIGLYGSYDRKPGEEYVTGAYHCWAEFRIPGKAWVPVDI